MVLLCDYTRQKFGWTKGKFDDTMIPVLRRMEESKNQKLLDMYFKVSTARSIESSLSKRVQKAVRKLNNEDDIEGENVNGEHQTKRSKKSGGAVQKSSREENAIEAKVSTSKSPDEISITLEKPVKHIIQKKYNTKEYIPQREKDKACALERKLHAIEVFRKSKRGLAKTKKVKCTTRKIKKEAELSESDSN